MWCHVPPLFAVNQRTLVKKMNIPNILTFKGGTVKHLYLFNTWQNLYFTYLLEGLSAPGCERLGFVSLVGEGAPEDVSALIGLVASLTSIVLEVPLSVAADKIGNKSSVPGTLWNHNGRNIESATENLSQSR